MSKSTSIRLQGNGVTLRPVTTADCNDAYVKWLNDSSVNQFLETRFVEQTLTSIKAFVSSCTTDPSTYLFAIIENATDRHIGNIKLGPINHFHDFTHLSYFIGEKSTWGKGYATEAIALASHFAFHTLKLNSIRAGAYETNIGSIKALQKCGYTLMGRFPSSLKCHGQYQDHLWFYLLKADDENHKYT